WRSTITLAMPARCSSWPNRRPDGPAPMMATWVLMLREPGLVFGREADRLHDRAPRKVLVLHRFGELGRRVGAGFEAELGKRLDDVGRHDRRADRRRGALHELGRGLAGQEEAVPLAHRQVLE